MDSELLLQKPWEERSPVDRRSESDTRRRTYDINLIQYKDSERKITFYEMNAIDINETTTFMNEIQNKVVEAKLLKTGLL